MSAEDLCIEFNYNVNSLFKLRGKILTIVLHEQSYEIDEIWKDIANYSGSNINHVSSINDNNCKKIFNSIDSKEEISQSVFIRCEKDIKNPIDVYIFSHLCEDKAVGHSLPIILLKDDLSVEDDYVGLLKKMIDFNVRHNCLV